jgi:hypothetical protein
VSGPGRQVELGERGLLIDGEWTPLVAGTLEYWRVNSLHWRRCLRQMRRAGIVQVSSFVCWDFHQTEDGTLDLTGRTHPSRDLAGFIDLCAREGFDFLLRLGPIIDAGWPTHGPIEEVCRLERIDPLYRERTAEFLAAVLEQVVARLATRGGPVVLIEIDNEPYFPYSTDAESDPSAGSMVVPYHRDQVLARYREWLTDRYGSDEELRCAWGCDTASLTDVKDPDYDADSLASVLDSFAFMSDVVAECLVWMRDICRAAGVDVPLYSNMKPLTHYIDWHEIEQLVDSHGLGMFFPNLLPGENALVASWYVRVERAVTRFPWAAEFQAVAPQGMEDVFGTLAPNHQRYITELSLAQGLRGLCYYTFVERDEHVAAPLSPIGKVRPQFEQLVHAITMAKQVRPDRQLRDVGLLWSIEQHRIAVSTRFRRWEQLHHIWSEMDVPKELPGWWSTFRELHALDVDFEVLQMDRGATAPVLIYAGPDCVRIDEWAAVLARVEAGAHLIASELPSRAILGDDDDIAAINAGLQVTGRTTVRDGKPLAAELHGAGVESYVNAGEAGVWTSAFETASGYQLFAVNVGEEPRSTAIQLGRRFAAALAGAEAHDSSGDRRWTVGGQTLLPEPVTLAPKESKFIQVERS